MLTSSAVRTILALASKEQHTGREYKLTVGTFAIVSYCETRPAVWGRAAASHVSCDAIYTAEAGTTISRWTPDLQNYRLRKVWDLLGCTASNPIPGLVFRVSIPGS